MELRPYQIEAIEKLRQKFREGKRRIVLQLPTGSGKTILSAEMIRACLAKKNKCIFTADLITLIEQTSTRFDEYGLSHGIIQGKHEKFDPNQPLQICSIQTLNKREFPPADFIVIDEVHTLHKAHIRLMEANPGIPVVGLSATPWTKGLGRYFDDLVVGCTTQELVDMGFLVDTRVFAPTIPDLSKVGIRAGDYIEKQLAETMDTKLLNGDIVDHWLRLGENRQTISFGVNVAHSKHIARQFQEAGISAAHIDGYMTAPKAAEERKQILENFRNGKIKILSSVGVLTKGFDYPGASCIVMARPTRSLMLFIQCLGRGIRSFPGKLDCLILDHSGNTLRHGFITDPLPCELDDGKKKETPLVKPKTEEKLPKVCPVCKFVKPAGLRTCPVCSFTPEKQSDIVHTDEQLVEVKKSKISREMKQNFYSELLKIQIENNYKAGWVANCFKDRFDIWPRKLLKIPAVDVSIETYNYVQAKKIKYSKDMRGKTVAASCEQ
jgi:superfamily II DNA or RNA helicase